MLILKDENYGLQVSQKLQRKRLEGPPLIHVFKLFRESIYKQYHKHSLGFLIDDDAFKKGGWEVWGDEKEEKRVNKFNCKIVTGC